MSIGRVKLTPIPARKLRGLVGAVTGCEEGPDGCSGGLEEKEEGVVFVFGFGAQLISSS